MHYWFCLLPSRTLVSRSENHAHSISFVINHGGLRVGAMLQRFYQECGGEWDWESTRVRMTVWLQCFIFRFDLFTSNLRIKDSSCSQPQFVSSWVTRITFIFTTVIQHVNSSWFCSLCFGLDEGFSISLLGREKGLSEALLSPCCYTFVFPDQYFVCYLLFDRARLEGCRGNHNIFRSREPVIVFQLCSWEGQKSLWLFVSRLFHFCLSRPNILSVISVICDLIFSPWELNFVAFRTDVFRLATVGPEYSRSWEPVICVICHLNFVHDISEVNLTFSMLFVLRHNSFVSKQPTTPNQVDLISFVFISSECFPLIYSAP